MKAEVKTMINSGYPGLFLQTPEEVRVEGTLKQIGAEINYHVASWSSTRGLMFLQDDRGDPSTREGMRIDEMGILAQILASDERRGEEWALPEEQRIPEKCIIILKDYHFYIGGEAQLIRLMKDALPVCKRTGRVIVITAVRKVLPPELEREIALVEVGLPTAEELVPIAEELASINNFTLPQGPELIAKLGTLKGLTTNEAEDAISRSFVEKREIDVEVLGRAKVQAIAKSGYLEVINIRPKLSEVGGFGSYKGHLTSRAVSFQQMMSSAYEGPPLRGDMHVGPPGTGKSLIAKVAASVFGTIIVRMDIGKLKGSHVGESEQAMRAAIRQLEAMSPCICWIDEVEKGLGGVESSAKTDGGTTLGMYDALLYAMQEGLKGVYFIGTANSVDGLEGAFLRRFGKTWFVDLPSLPERVEIWKIHANRYAKSFDMEAIDFELLAQCTDGYSGSEIEKCVEECWFMASDLGQKVDNDIATLAASQIVPVSTTKAKEIQAVRDWAHSVGAKCVGSDNRSKAPAAPAAKGRRLNTTVAA